MFQDNLAGNITRLAKKRGPGASRGGRAYRGQGYPAGETGVLYLLKVGIAGKLNL